MREEELYEPMRVWLEQYLKDKYKRYDVVAVDAHAERLDRVLAKYDIVNEMANGVDIQIDDCLLRDLDTAFNISQRQSQGSKPQDLSILGHMKTSFIINLHREDAEFHYKGASLMTGIALSAQAERCFPRAEQVLENSP